MTTVKHDIGRVLVVVIDREHARFFDVEAGDAPAVELPGLHSPAMRGGKFHSDRQGGPGWGEREYHGRIREEERRHVAAVVDRLVRLDQEREADGFLVAGPGPSASALMHALPPAIAERVIGTTHLNPTELTPAVVARAARTARATHEPVVEREILAEVQKGLGRGRATNGVHETLHALAQDQVGTLLVRPDVRGSGFRCAISGRLVLSDAECVAEGEAMPVADLVGAAMQDAREHGAAVIEIHDAEVAKQIEGLAALLRFSQGGGT
ncbi:MAG TPA: host attachment protein [Gemmatimonadales bacterium]|nr:host attachment protein [Gemmatimonadales bacterium]